MTDEQIVKALECCINYNDCDKCDFEPKKSKKKSIGCCMEIMQNAIDLITRQQAEIERLKNRPYTLQIEVSKKIESQIKAKAIKEFAERLCEFINEIEEGHKMAMLTSAAAFAFGMEREIDKLVKEMVGDEE